MGVKETERERRKKGQRDIHRYWVPGIVVIPKHILASVLKQTNSTDKKREEMEHQREKRGGKRGKQGMGKQTYNKQEA